jgi:hypothetical protein
MVAYTCSDKTSMLAQRDEGEGETWPSGWHRHCQLTVNHMSLKQHQVFNSCEWMIHLWAECISKIYLYTNKYEEKDWRINHRTEMHQSGIHYWECTSMIPQESRIPS